MAKKVTTEKTTAKAPAKKAAAQKPQVYLQYNGNEVDTEAVVNAAKAEFKAEKGRVAIKTCQVYLKPQEGAAYYVINGDFTGKIAL